MDGIEEEILQTMSRSTDEPRMPSALHSPSATELSRLLSRIFLQI
jgi:hypothetical protein